MDGWLAIPYILVSCTIKQAVYKQMAPIISTVMIPEANPDNVKAHYPR